MEDELRLACWRSLGGGGTVRKTSVVKSSSIQLVQFGGLGGSGRVRGGVPMVRQRGVGYLFRVSLPGVTRDEKVISCEVRPDGRILVKGESTTGERTVCKHNGWEKPNLEDQEKCSVDSGTFLQLLALFGSCFSSLVCMPCSSFHC
ncbi:Increased DNA methylation 2 [Capsicum baccatum]|uniref:Increased DNA methylation 2 n=1 Tax=Capsicum baccatum TaxID=33114 RepID=A0A2G2UWC3_CAPBA|nr:Increased DNA methylation 2 [Capsicum baccatum]PHT28695.1 Increased DNA methylation 2 [Capsicum baccatum]